MSSLGSLLSYGDEESSSDDDSVTASAVPPPIPSTRPVQKSETKRSSPPKKKKCVTWATGTDLAQTFLFNTNDYTRSDAFDDKHGEPRSFTTDALFAVGSSFAEKRHHEEKLQVKPSADIAPTTGDTNNPVGPKLTDAKPQSQVKMELFCDECDSTILRGKVRYDCNLCEYFFCLCQKCYKSTHHLHPHKLIPNVSSRHLTE